MAFQIQLQRFGQSNHVPAPNAVRAGDYIYTSSIYPIDKSGHAIAVDDAIGETGPSLVEAQTRQCFETLKQVLKEAGSNLDNPSRTHRPKTGKLPTSTLPTSQKYQPTFFLTTRLRRAISARDPLFRPAAAPAELSPLARTGGKSTNSLKPWG